VLERELQRHQHEAAADVAEVLEAAPELSDQLGVVARVLLVAELGLHLGEHPERLVLLERQAGLPPDLARLARARVRELEVARAQLEEARHAEHARVGDVALVAGLLHDRSAELARLVQLVEHAQGGREERARTDATGVVAGLVLHCRHAPHQLEVEAPAGEPVHHRPHSEREGLPARVSHLHRGCGPASRELRRAVHVARAVREHRQERLDVPAQGRAAAGFLQRGRAEPDRLDDVARVSGQPEQGVRAFWPGLGAVEHVLEEGAALLVVAGGPARLARQRGAPPCSLALGRRRELARALSQLRHCRVAAAGAGRVGRHLELGGDPLVRVGGAQREVARTLFHVRHRARQGRVGSPALGVARIPMYHGAEQRMLERHGLPAQLDDPRVERWAECLSRVGAERGGHGGKGGPPGGGHVEERRARVRGKRGDAVADEVGERARHRQRAGGRRLGLRGEGARQLDGEERIPARQVVDPDQGRSPQRDPEARVHKVVSRA